MLGIPEISSALSGIKVAADMVKGIGALKSGSEINQAVINIQRTLLEAQNLALQDRERQIELIGKIEKLEREVSRLNDVKSDKDRYELKEFPTGAFAYVLKDNDSTGEPSHRVCAKCFGDGKTSILQVINKHSGGESVRCPSCSQKYTLHPFPQVKVIPNKNSWMSR